MATQHIDFDTPDGEAPRYSGSFTLGGKVWNIRHRDDIPFETVRRLMGAPEATEGGTPEETAARAREVVLQTGPFFADTIATDQVDDFMEMFSQPNSPLTIGKLRPIMEYVSQLAFSEEERPTQPSRTSGPGRSTTGRTSKGGSSSRGTRKVRSAS